MKKFYERLEHSDQKLRQLSQFCRGVILMNNTLNDNAVHKGCNRNLFLKAIRMDKKKLLLLTLIFCIVNITTAQSFNDKVYKEVTVNGEKLYKWLKIFCLQEYDVKGKEIHYKSSYGTEYWKEYDAKGNEIHYKSRDGYEWWYEYEYYPTGIIKSMKCWAY